MVGGNLKLKVPDSRDLELDSHFSAPLSAHSLKKSKADLIEFLFIGKFQSKNNNETSPRVEW
jgi:hypothetical protein